MQRSTGLLRAGLKHGPLTLGRRLLSLTQTFDCTKGRGQHCPQSYFTYVRTVLYGRDTSVMVGYPTHGDACAGEYHPRLVGRLLRT
jgi:hypothetical protein